MFHTIVNSDGKCISLAFQKEYKDGKEARFIITELPCIFEPFYDTIEKIQKYYWTKEEYPYLDWSGLKMQKVKIEFIS